MNVYRDLVNDGDGIFCMVDSWLRIRASEKEGLQVIVNHRNSFIIDFLAYSPRTIQRRIDQLQNSSRHAQYSRCIDFDSKMCKKVEIRIFLFFFFFSFFCFFKYKITFARVIYIVSISLQLSFLKEDRVHASAFFFEIQKRIIFFFFLL